MQRNRYYVVRQCEDVDTVAGECGADAGSLWAVNGERLPEGRNPDVLGPGDVLLVDESAPRTRPVEPGAVNVFVSRPTTRELTINLGRTHAGAEVRYGERDAMVDDEGILEVEVPTHWRSLSLMLSTMTTSLEFQIAGIDPISLRRGQIERLRAMGYYRTTFAASVLEEAATDPLCHAWSAFQEDMGHETTGHPTAEELEALARRFGG